MQLAPCEYKTGKKLGEGSYSVVKEAVHIKSGTKYAVKVISKSLMRGKEEMILNEINILKQVSQGHPNIITLHDFFETPNNLYLVMDLCQGGELFDSIYEKGYFYETDAASIVKIVLDAIAYLHDRNIVHRDIKPENLIFKKKDSVEDLVIADFGLSKMTDDEQFQMRTRCGTPGYMAPEVILGKGYGKPVDLWSIGVLTYFLLCGYTPFDGSSNTEEIQNVLSAKYGFEPEEYWKDVSYEAKEFIKTLLQANPEKRASAREALEHPWIHRYAIATVPALKDLFPNVKERFNAKKAFKKAIDVVKAVNKLQAFGGNGLPSLISEKSSENLALMKPIDEPNDEGQLMVIKK